MAFAKGQSGNPGGRKKKTAQQELFESRCREKLSTKGWETLSAMLEGEDRQDRRYALDKMLEYGYLAPAKNIDIVEHEPVDERPDSEIVDEINSILAGAKGAVGEESNPPKVEAGE